MQHPERPDSLAQCPESLSPQTVPTNTTAAAETVAGEQEKRELVETRLLDYLRCLENSNREREFYLVRPLNDFPLESLEVFELITEIEEAIAVTVSDEVFDATLTVAEVIERICAEPCH
ncbi:MAG: hypothetical protein ACKOXO_12380 [Cyanobium sp.]